MTILRYNKKIYSKEALLKSAYSFLDRAYIHLDCDETYYLVEMREKERMEPVTLAEFEDEMLAQSLRHEIYLQTKNLREILFARAMSTSLVVNEEENCDTEREERKGRGFQNPVMNKPVNDQVFTEEEILEDWFKKYE